jgi:hypothetical protein
MMAQLAVLNLLTENGRYSDALVLGRKLTLKSEAMLGPQHRTVFAVKFVTAHLVVLLGAHNEGLAELDNAVEEAAQVLGPLDAAVASRNIIIIDTLARSGMVDEARKRLVALRNAYSTFPKEHIITSWLDAAVRNLQDRHHQD